MTIGPLHLARHEQWWRRAAVGLVIAAAIVSTAIVVGGAASRMLNGIGVVLWVGSGVLLALSLPPARRPAVGWVAAAAAALLLGGVIRPGNLAEVAIGFGLAGAAIVLVAGDCTGGWALLAPALYLPVHLVIGIGRAIVQAGGVRTDPPPTAAIVPLAIVVAAGLAGALAAAIVRAER